jgi:hypothetical protein
LSSSHESVERGSNHEHLEKYTCEAAGCESTAARQINVSAGKFGKITLFVCEQCVSKFT